MHTHATAGHVRAKRTDSVPELLALLDALPANVALWDADVRLRYANRRQIVRFGDRADELAGARLGDLVQPHAVELSARYIDGALAGRPQQVERAMIDPSGQRYNAHQVTHVPNVVDGDVIGYCALAVDITASLEGFEHARRARERAALDAERERVAGDLDQHHVLDDLNAALRRLDAALGRASEAVPSLRTAADVIDRTIGELRATVSPRMVTVPADADPVVAFPAMSTPFGADPPGAVEPAGVQWPATVTGSGWTDEDVRALLDLVPAAIATWDSSFRNTYANRVALRWLGVENGDDLLGASARELLGVESVEGVEPFALAALAGEPQQLDRTVVHASGLRHVQVWYLPRLHAGGVEGIHTFVVDVTARIEAELALQDVRADLASAQERQRIADDLHNMVIQRLFAASLAASPPATVTEGHLRSVQDGIVAALDDLESALTSLHENVGVLDVLPALAGLVHGTTRPHGITASIENVGSVDYVPPGVASELLAVLHEALTNVVENSSARSVVVTVAADADEVWLRVADDGQDVVSGASVDAVAEMRRRAELLGGSCSWRRTSPAGTLVDWRVPTPR